MKPVLLMRRLLFLLLLFSLLALFPRNGLSIDRANPEPLGKGSLPSRLFPNGTVCLVSEKNPTVCLERLVRVPQRILKKRFVTFYGVFDIDRDGIPEVFLGYWPPLANQDEDNTVLLVYKKIHGKYRQYLRLKAESIGYSPGAWFLNESPHPKAIFMTRYGGSSGGGLYYLNLRKKRLELISGPVFLEGNPKFLDIDGDGMAEIFMPGRGRDRTSQPGAALLHWRDNGYEMWWPNWKGLPRVIYATLADIDGDGKKEIIAVLEPNIEVADSNNYVDGETRTPRELGIWKVTANDVILLSKTVLPDARYLSEPRFVRVLPFSSTIELDYTRTFGCALEEDKIVCREKE